MKHNETTMSRLFKGLHYNRLKHRSQISAVGCVYAEPPPWGWLEQDQWDYNTVTVHCNNSDASWKLFCDGNKWTTQGSVSKCPKGEFYCIKMHAIFMVHRKREKLFPYFESLRQEINFTSTIRYHSEG